MSETTVQRARRRPGPSTAVPVLRAGSRTHLDAAGARIHAGGADAGIHPGGAGARLRSRAIAGLLLALSVSAPLPAAPGPTGVVVSSARQVSAPPPWNQWRGPRRDGHAAVDLPEDLPVSPSRVWRAVVGPGPSGPVTDGHAVYAFARDGGDEVLRALGLDDGTPLWEGRYPAPYEVDRAAAGHGLGPRATPVVADGRVVTQGISGILTAWDAADGTVLWRHDFADRYATTAPFYGAAASPLVAGGRVVAQVGGVDDGAVVALDPGDGSVLWEQSLDGPGYASPVLASVAGVEQIVTQTQRHIVGLDPGDGALLWRLPFTTDYDQNIVTPLVAGNRIVVSGLDRGLFALAPGATEAGEAPAELWRNDDVPQYMSSPVLAAGRLLGFSHRRSGQFFAVDASSGETLWSTRGREGENAALIVAGERVLALTDEAELIVLRAAAAEYRPLASWTLPGSATWAHPALTGAGLLVKDRDSVSLFRF